MNNEVKSAYDNYRKKIIDEEKIQLKCFFSKFDEYCQLDTEVNEKIKEDFIKALLLYINNGYTQKKALELLDIKCLGDFYLKRKKRIYELDDIAKSYSISYDFSSMFRLSFYLKNEIIPELLQMALNITINNFPIFGTVLKKGFFWHYLETSNKRFYIEKENDLPCQSINFLKKELQLFRVLYYKNRISLEVFHCLTDGTGGTMFFKCLLTEYLRLTGVETTKESNVFDVNSSIDLNELEKYLKNEKVDGKRLDYFDIPSIQLSGKFSKNRPCQIIHFKLDTEKLKKYLIKIILQ